MSTKFSVSIRELEWEIDRFTSLVELVDMLCVVPCLLDHPDSFEIRFVSSCSFSRPKGSPCHGS